jgi:hypothetical protein
MSGIAMFSAPLHKKGVENTNYFGLWKSMRFDRTKDVPIQSSVEYEYLARDELLLNFQKLRFLLYHKVIH